MKRNILIILLAGMLGWMAHAAAGPLVILGRASDADGVADRAAGAIVCVMEKCASKDQKELTARMAEAGAAETRYIGGAALKAEKRTAEALEKKWGTEKIIAACASALRDAGADEIICYSEDDVTQAYLEDFALKTADAAADPDVRWEKNKQDQYIYQAKTVVNGRDGTETAIPARDTAAELTGEWGQATEPDLPGLPETDGDGFVTGETPYVLSDSEGGVWAYIDGGLRIVITRHKGTKLTWYEADVRRKADADYLHVITPADGKGAQAWEIAQESRAVLAINTDYYHIRKNYKKNTGLIIRGGEIVSEMSGKGSLSGLPSLDTLALDSGGGFEVAAAGELSAETAIAEGKNDVLSFGPMLIRDGRYRILRTGNRTKKEPRTAIGVLEPNHYLIVVAEGRLSESPGMTLTQLGQLMLARGCTDAINLDGGHTSVLIFLGARVNKIGSLDGKSTSSPRTMYELLSIGTAGEEVSFAEGNVKLWQ